MAETLDEIGPVDWLVVEFPGPDFGKGQIATSLEFIMVLDMVWENQWAGSFDDFLCDAVELSNSSPLSSTRP